MQAGEIFVASGIGLQQVAVAAIFINFFIGRQPPMSVSRHDDVVHPLVVDLRQPTDAVVVLIEYECTVKRTNDHVSAPLPQGVLRRGAGGRKSLSHTRHIVASQQVGVFSIAAKHQHLPPVVATQAASLGGIPEESLRVLHHLQHPLRRQLLLPRQSKSVPLLRPTR